MLIQSTYFFILDNAFFYSNDSKIKHESVAVSLHVKTELANWWQHSYHMASHLGDTVSPFLQ